MKQPPSYILFISWEVTIDFIYLAMKFTYDVILLAIAYDQAAVNNQNQYVHSRFQKWFYNQLSEMERR